MAGHECDRRARPTSQHTAFRPPQQQPNRRATIVATWPGKINAGKGATVTPTKPGTYTYYCQFHAFMHGTVVLR